MASEFEFGPKMQALTHKQRAFVMALVEFPGASRAEAARMAGYSDTKDAAKVRACELMQDRKVVEAIQEQGGKRLWATSLKAAAKLDELIDSDDPAIALKAAAAVLDRAALAPQQTINVNQNVTDSTGRAVMERIQRAAAVLGVDPAQLLGIGPLKVIEHDPQP